jgi:AAHS family 4-hydroxybenzoate transporter-like MFS transporter
LSGAWRVIALCSLASFADGYDIQTLGLAIPGMAAEYGVTPPELTFAVSASLVGTALGAMFLGPLGDRLGRKEMLIAFLALIGATSIGTTLADDLMSLSLWRFACGLGLGAIVPVAVAAVAEAASARHRTFAVTLMVICTPLGSFCAGFAGAAIEPAWGWQAIFATGGAFALVAAVLVWMMMPPLRVQGESGASPSPRALLTGPLRNRTVLLSIVFWLNLFVAYSLISWLPSLLADAGWERSSAQRATGMLALGGMSGGLMMAWLVDRGFAGRALAASYMITAGLFLAFAVGTESRAVWMVLIVLVGAGCIGAQMALGSFSASLFPPELRATGVGWTGGFGRIGAIVGPMALAAMLAAQVMPAMILATLMVPMVFCAIGVIALTRSLAR